MPSFSTKPFIYTLRISSPSLATLPPRLPVSSILKKWTKSAIQKTQRSRRQSVRSIAVSSDFVCLFFLFQYSFIEHTHLQLAFTKDNVQQNENYNLKLTKKKPNTIKALVVTKIKWERNQLSKQNFIPYLKETKKQTILF